MRHIIIGANGSIGKRHTANLRILARGDEILSVDPVGKADYRYLNEVKWQPNDVVYICTPTKFHWEHLNLAVYHLVRAVFVEKPLFSKDETRTLITDVPIACGYNYRFHHEYAHLPDYKEYFILMNVIGIENMADRYGNTALETMLSHYLDLSVWLFGEPQRISIIDRGYQALANLTFSKMQVNIISVIDSITRNVNVSLLHRCGQIQSRDLTRQSWLDQMYVNEMAAWLNFLETGERNRLCFYEDAMRVQQLMQEANK